MRHKAQGGIKRTVEKLSVFYLNAAAASRFFRVGFLPIKTHAKNRILACSLENLITRTLKAVLTEKEN